MSQERADDESKHTILLDSSAVLAVLFDEVGAEAVIRHLPFGSISAVNLAETVAKAMAKGADFETTSELVLRLSLRVVDFTPQCALAAASFQPFNKSHNLSLADRCCLGTAVSLRLPILTGDRRWADLALPVAVHLIR